MRNKIKYSFFNALSTVFGSKKLRHRKLMTGIVLLSSMASILSCGHGRKTMCYVEPMDSTLGNDTIKATCYEQVAIPDSESVVVPDTQELEEQIMCYKQVAPEHDDNEQEPSK